jgi:ketosteroid isomerase-like protein
MGETITGTELVSRWADAFNDDIEAMVELYAPDAVLGGATMGHEKLLRFERRVLAAAPQRRMRIERAHACGDGVMVVEAVLTDPDQGPDWKVPFCAVLTVRDGRIVRDDTYAEFSRWPGMGATS